MKRVIRASEGGRCIIKVQYAEGLNTEVPVLRSMTVTGLSKKAALMATVESLSIPYLGLDFSEPDEVSFQELLDAVMYRNTSVGEYDYIFTLSIDGDFYIDNSGPEENYSAEDILR